MHVMFSVSAHLNDSCVCVCVFVFVCLQVEKELKSICNDILDVLDKHLILAATTGESKVFYYKMYVIINV